MKGPGFYLSALFLVAGAIFVNSWGGGSSGDGGDAVWSHSITIDGTSDFVASDEQFPTTTGCNGYATWDSTYLYAGLEGLLVNDGDFSKWFTIYMGETGGTTAGMAYGPQQPTRPFSAGCHVQWHNAGISAAAFAGSGSSWVNAGGRLTGEATASGTYVEMRIPLVDIGSPTSLDLHLCLLEDSPISEWTWAGVPSTSFTDGLDPDYTKYVSFDLTGATPPNGHAALA